MDSRCDDIRCLAVPLVDWNTACLSFVRNYMVGNEQHRTLFFPGLALLFVGDAGGQRGLLGKGLLGFANRCHSGPDPLCQKSVSSS